MIIDDPYLADADHFIDAEVPCQCLLSFNNKATFRSRTGGPANVRELPADDTPESNKWSTR
ncbi:MAG TPA: hypothetical protein VFN76_08350, partial [Candidatus Limnocylindria bacterium]|nr:hypothetical protein [Candidatus Limnocylindria bacterium]